MLSSGAQCGSERSLLSCANLVIDKGNTLLDEDEIEKVVVLRMNRDFMEYWYMRKEYPEMVKELTRQHDPREGRGSGEGLMD